MSCCLILCAGRVEGQLTRQEAVDALLDPGSGVSFDTTNAAVWSPFVDFGSGTGFEGLLPAGSTVEPKHLGLDPSGGPSMPVPNESYFFWIDDEQMAMFRHDTRFVLVDAQNPSPSVTNGGIQVTAQGWWPVITPPGGASNDYFGIDLVRTSANPPGFGNPEGLIAGVAPDPSLVQPSAFAPSAPAAAAEGAGAAGQNPYACGLIVRGAPDVHMGHNVKRFEQDLIDHYGVPTNRIIKVNNGEACTFAQFQMAITDLCNLQPPCKKIFVRIASHGLADSLQFQSSLSTNFTLIHENSLDIQFRRLAMKGVPICLMISACHSGGLLDNRNWGFPVGSSIITSASAENLSWGGGFYGSPASLYVTAHSQCLNSSVTPDIDLDGDGFINDCEAHDWVEKVRPGFRWRLLGPLSYPAGPPAGTPGLNPAPQKRAIGNSPIHTVLTACNITPGPKTDFHIQYEGNVTNVLTRASLANPDGSADPTGWATNGVSVSYDPTNDLTMVCWTDTNNPIGPNKYINVGVFRRKGGLRPAQQFWTPTTTPPAEEDLVPAQTVYFDAMAGQTNGVVEWTQALEQTNSTQTNTWSHRFYRMPLPEENFHRGDPLYTNAPPTDDGTHVLPPNDKGAFNVPLPSMPDAPLPTMVLDCESSWDVNAATTIELSQFYLPLPPGETTDVSACPGSTVFFTINPPGPNSTYQWYMEGQPIPGETNATMIVTNLQFNDSSIYTGICTNLSEFKRRFFVLEVEDLVPPVVICPPDIVVECTSPTGTPVGFGVSAGDSCGSIVSFETDPPSGSLFPLGTTPVTATVTDTGGNTSECTFNVTVVLSNLDIAGNNGQLTLTWDDCGGVLHSGWEVTGPWTPMPGATSPYTFTPMEDREFFLLLFSSF